MTTVNRFDYTVSLDGVVLDAAERMHVHSLHVTHIVNQTSHASLSVQIWKDNTTDISQDDALLRKFAIGAAIRIELGYIGAAETQAVFVGEIVEHQMVFGTRPTLTVGCQCNGLKLTRSSKVRVFAESDSSDGTVAISNIVEQVAQEAGLQAECDLTDTCNYLVQRDQTDWEFLLQLAVACGACLFVRDKTVHVKKLKDGGTADYTYAWGQDLSDLRIELDTRDVPSKVTYRAIEAASEVPIEATVELSSLTIPMAATIANLLQGSGNTGGREIADSSKDVDADELKRRATAQLTRALLAAARGEARLAGQPAVDINTVLAVDNAGSYTSNQYVSSVTHSIDAHEFTTNVTFGLDQLGPPRDASGGPPSSTAAATRISPGAGTLVLGRVEAYDDSQKLGLIKVSLPWMGSDAKPIWASLAEPSAGGRRGFMAIPEPGDQVVLGFLDDDAGSPVIMGSLWNSKNQLPDLYDPEKNSRSAWVSRSGHRIVFDDSDDKQQILLKSQAGQSILVDDASSSEKIHLTDKAGNQVLLDAGGSGGIVLTDSNGNSIHLDSSGIRIAAASGKRIQLESSSGDVQISAMNVEAKAKTSMELSAVNGKVEGKAKLDLSGAQVALRGSAMIQAQAPLIKLN